MKPVGYITWDGGRIVGQGEREIGVEIWLRDQNGYPFTAYIKLNRSALEKTKLTGEEPNDTTYL